MAALRELAAACAALPPHVLVGLSGGADSVALLLALQEAGRRVEAVHVHHGLRGAGADGDEAFVRQLCRERSIPLLCYHATPPDHAGEGWAREARYAFFRQAMAETGADALVLAHQQDDQAETVLLHLLRGSGLTGLTGIRQNTFLGGMRVVRPLLGFSHRALCEALTALGQPWREDETNAENRYLRNQVRHEVLPLLERLQPGAVRRVAQTALTLQPEEDSLRALTERFLQNGQQAGEDWLSLTALAGLEKQGLSGLMMRILRLWWQNAVGDLLQERTLSQRQTAAMAEVLARPAGAVCNLPMGWQAVAGWRCLHLVRPEHPVPPPVPMTADGAQWGGITLLVAEGGSATGDGILTQRVPKSLLTGTVLRAWQPGDTLRPFGMRGRKSMQDVFSDHHVDRPFRHRVPLLCCGSEVLLAAGVCAGAVPRAEECTGDTALLTWSGEMPWTLPEWKREEIIDLNR